MTGKIGTPATCGIALENLARRVVKGSQELLTG